MRIYSITDKEFCEYGRILENYDFSELFRELASTEKPKSGIISVASDKRLERCGVADELKNRGFGGYPIQIGYVNGDNRKMNCLEYHKSSEFNIPADDIILILGKEKDITNGTYDTENCKAFLVPGGSGVELYGTTLHYAPFNVRNDAYRVICVLPKGTNESFDKKTEPESTEDKMCLAVNKWLMAHKDTQEAENGAYVGLVGKNISFDDLKF